jgi:predicted XRE-type DNA-binding protein
MKADDATIHALRSDLALQIARHVSRSGESQVRESKRLRIPQPTLSKILNGRI